MTRILVGRPDRDQLCKMDITAEQAKLIDQQISALVEYQLDKVNGYIPLRDQMRELARNCYLQGVLDGNQVPRKEKSCSEKI